MEVPRKIGLEYQTRTPRRSRVQRPRGAASVPAAAVSQTGSSRLASVRVLPGVLSSHGINERALEDLAINDLPLLPKKTLIDNFDRAVTDPRLRRKELSEWFETHHDPNEAFCSDIVAIHGSGTSGDIGIFAYDRKAWIVADATVATHLPMPENYPAGKTRIAFYVSAKGHFATVSMAVSLPKDVYDPLILSLLDPTEETIRQLNAFQPHRLTGYSSSVAQLAEIALEGKLKIAPQRIFVGGDKLTPSMERNF